MKRVNKNAQVWIETVIYTLIGLAIIGLLLSVSKPKIDAIRDKILIEQTIDSLNEINTKIYDVQIAAGNKRTMQLKVSKGKFYVNGTSNEIGWTLDSNYQYSEVNRLVTLGNLYALTEEAGPYNVKLSMNYTVNVSHERSENYVQFDASPAPYTIVIENRGIPSGGSVVNVDLAVS